MLSLDNVKKILHGPTLTTRDQFLVLIAMDPIGPLQVAEIKDRCARAGVPKLAKKNVSGLLSAAHGFIARTDKGWELQSPGLLRVRDIAKAVHINLVVTHSSQSLRGHADSVTDPLTKSFVLEGIGCFEAHQFRAAVVFTWAGAIALLHQHVFVNKLAAFNTEATRRDAKWKLAKQQDDLGRMKEHDFLDVCESIGVIGKNVKLVLQNDCLMLRNGCGHPNSLAIAENSVASHIEKLIKNVFSRF
jgi:hypothetical protein